VPCFQSGHCTVLGELLSKGERDFGALMVPDPVILNTETRKVGRILKDTLYFLITLAKPTRCTNFSNLFLE